MNRRRKFYTPKRVVISVGLRRSFTFRGILVRDVSLKEIRFSVLRLIRALDLSAVQMN